MHLTRYVIGTAVLAAIGTAQSTTEVKVFAAGTSTIAMTNMQASVLNADATATTYVMTCAPSELSCVLSAPATFTAGPSTFDQSLVYSTSSDDIGITLTVSQTCKITSSTQTASCSMSVNEVLSLMDMTTTTSTQTQVAFPSSEIFYDTLTVTGGVEKLVTASQTATNAAPTHNAVGGAMAAVGVAALAMI